MNALQGDVEVPAVGKVDKRVLVGIGAVAAAFVGWKWWQARGAGDYQGEGEPTDPGFEGGEVLPSVDGAVRPGNDYGLGGQDEDDSTSYGFRGKSNSQWTQYATQQLLQSDRWSYTDIVEALGNFLANKPLDTGDQAIVQAAIALAGYPPEGSHVIIPGGNTPVTVAPGGVRVTAADVTATVSWSPVAGATAYNVYRNDQSSAAPQRVSGTSVTLYNLDAGRSYRVQVSAVSDGGKEGPKSGPVAFSTKATALKAPTGVRGTSPTKYQIVLSWAKVAGAEGYNVYRSDQSSAAPQRVAGTSVTLYNLTPGRAYKLQVAAVAPSGHVGAKSPTITVKTKTK